MAQWDFVNLFEISVRIIFLDLLNFHLMHYTEKHIMFS